MSTIDEEIIQMKTALFGVYGNNGLNSDVKRHSEQIGDLYGRDETLRKDIDQKLESIHRQLFTLLIAVTAGAIGIIGALLATQL